jgi:hypothetical protein
MASYCLECKDLGVREKLRYVGYPQDIPETHPDCPGCECKYDTPGMNPWSQCQNDSTHGGVYHGSMSRGIDVREPLQPRPKPQSGAMSLVARAAQLKRTIDELRKDGWSEKKIAEKLLED